MHGIGRDFVEMTKHKNLVGPTDQQRGAAPPPIEHPPLKGHEILDLPSPRKQLLAHNDFRSLVGSRTSLREYASEPLSAGDLSWLLWCCQGVKEVVNNFVSLRTVPSAGARHALETWVLVNAVQNVTPGLHRYLALGHRLEIFNREPKTASRIVRACLDQAFVGQSQVSFVWVADVPRMKWRYGERGYRYLYLDAGHACQNLYLAAESIGCGACAVAAFDDDEMNKILGLDGQDRFVIYIAAVGRKKAVLRGPEIG